MATVTSNISKNNWTTSTTTSASSINGLSEMIISTDSATSPAYSINIGGTSLTTEDIEFVHALQKHGGSAQDVSLGLQNLMRKVKADWTYIPPVYTWTTTSGTGSLKYDNTIKYNPIQKKEDNMNMFKNFHFGPCGDRAKISHLGIAVLNGNQEWVSYDKETNEIVNVDLINFGDGNYVYMIPVSVKDVHVGDAIIHHGHIMFVKTIKPDYFQVVDVTAGEIKRIVPTKSVFGFDFITKIVSLIDVSGISASEDNPFGDLFPLMMLNQDSSMLPFFFLNKDKNIDPMLLSLIAMDHNKNDILPFLLMQYIKK